MRPETHHSKVWNTFLSRYKITPADLSHGDQRIIWENFGPFISAVESARKCLSLVKIGEVFQNDSLRGNMQKYRIFSVERMVRLAIDIFPNST
ncbi:hypothetical protein AGOR_G00247670 [Albula goreensis]|uniref:Uncharacterized protein n=1 Tax=Albula goreensis TaxID=1534307 RepID=A0A8T3CBF7_9TELE|nr:hypothetical protein AGOR_G00247670 [Albula goreensis]